MPSTAVALRRIDITGEHLYDGALSILEGFDRPLVLVVPCHVSSRRNQVVDRESDRRVGMNYVQYQRVPREQY